MLESIVNLIYFCALVMQFQKCYSVCLCFRFPDGGDGSLPWKQFDMKGKSYLEFDVSIRQGSNFKPEMMEVWSTQIPPVQLEVLDKIDRDEL